MQITVFELGSMGANCYIIVDEPTKTCAVVDPGGSGQALAGWFGKEGLTPKYVFLTHGHFDHVGGVKALMEAYPQLPVYVHAEDTDLGDHLGRGLAWTHHYGEGQTFSMGDLSFRIFSTPGHTPGSVCIQVEDALLTGDTLFAGSCGRTDFPKGSWSQILASLRRLAAMEGHLRVFPGHGEASTIEAERSHNPYMKEALQG